MKIKFTATINNMSLKKDGEYRLEFKVSFADIANAMSTIQVLGKGFKIGILSEEGSRSVITDAYFYKLIVDREGESKVIVSYPYGSIDNESLAFFGKNQDTSVSVIIKND